MSQTTTAVPVHRVLLNLAAFVIIVTGMYQARPLLVPFLLSVFIAIIAAPALFFLKRHRVPAILAMILVIAGITAIGMLLGVLIGNSVDDFIAQLPTYQARLKSDTGALMQWLSAHGFPAPEHAIGGLLDPGRAMNMAAQGLSSLGGLLTDTLLILITVVFILLEASSLPAKLQRVFANPGNSIEYLNRTTENIKRYMAIKTWTSLLTGAAVAVWLKVVGVDYPILWGTVAFLLNYVPNIGSFIAAVPAILLAVVQLGPGAALWAMAGYVVINNLVGNFIEPRFMGRGLGLSPLVVFLSLVFWGWILGTVGMFLSVPLTMTLKIALDSREETRWLAILLGPEIPESDGQPPPAGNRAPGPTQPEASDGDRSPGTPK